MKHEPYRSRKLDCLLGAKASFMRKTCRPPRPNTQNFRSNSRRRSELKRQEKERNLNRKVATQRGRLADALAIGLHQDVELHLIGERLKVDPRC